MSHQVAFCIGNIAQFLASPPETNGRTFINPAALSQEEFEALVTKVNAGTVRELCFRARVFGDAPNLNLTRPSPGQLSAIAATAANALYLYDHRVFGGADARIGRVLGGSTEVFEGVEVLVLDVAVTDRTAQESFLRGHQDRFSVGLMAESEFCSVCEEPAGWGWFGPILECKHDLGNEYDGVLCEVFMDGCSLAELSSVNFPAYEDTAVLAAFSRANHTGQPVRWHSTEGGTMPGKNNGEGAASTAAEQSELDRLRAENATYKAAAEQSKASEKAANDAAFEAVFKSAIGRKVLPNEKKFARTIYDAHGPSGFNEWLDSKAPVLGHSAEVLGDEAGDPQPAGQASTDKWSKGLELADTAVEMGLIKSASKESLTSTGFGRRRFSGQVRVVD